MVPDQETGGRGGLIPPRATSRRLPQGAGVFLLWPLSDQARFLRYMHLYEK